MLAPLPFGRKNNVIDRKNNEPRSKVDGSLARVELVGAAPRRAAPFQDRLARRRTAGALLGRASRPSKQTARRDRRCRLAGLCARMFRRHVVHFCVTRC